MQYREIVAVTGLGGLYQLLSSKSGGAVVRNLADNTTKFISARMHHVTPLESIEIYTIGTNVRLHEVLGNMKESETPRPDAKASPADIRTYFKTVYPDIDDERVYASDMKKMLRWYDILDANNLLDFSALQAAEEDAPADDTAMPAEGEAQIAEEQKNDSDAAVPLIEEGEEKPAKKARAKKADAPAAEDETTDEEKPAKKAAAKKKKDDSAE